MVGRQGNVLLVNGTKQPRFDAQSKGRERWRLVNTANGTFFNLTLPGHTFRVIGWDGGGATAAATVYSAGASATRAGSTGIFQLQLPSRLPRQAR